MPLTESEELELLELENEEALAVSTQNLVMNETGPSSGNASVAFPAQLASMVPLYPEPNIAAEGIKGFFGLPSNPQGFAEKGARAVGEIGLQTALAMGGEAVAGPAGAGAGAGAGTAIQEAARYAAGKMGYQTPPTTPYQAGKNIAKSAAINAATAGLGPLAARARQIMAPGAIKAGAQVMRAGSGLPQKYGEAMLGNMERFATAQSPEIVSESYKAFERYTGLKGLGEMVKIKGRFPGERELEDMLFETALKAKNGVATPQELYFASQSASNLKMMGKMGNPRYATLESAINGAKKSVDEALEVALPEYKNLRSDYMFSKAAEQASSILPLNANQTPNALRAWGAGGAALAGTLAGQPLAALGLAAVSPLTYGTAIKGLYYGGQIAGPALPFARAATGASLADFYRRQSSSPR